MMNRTAILGAATTLAAALALAAGPALAQAPAAGAPAPAPGAGHGPSAIRLPGLPLPPLPPLGRLIPHGGGGNTTPAAPAPAPAVVGADRAAPVPPAAPPAVAPATPPVAGVAAPPPPPPLPPAAPPPSVAPPPLPSMAVYAAIDGKQVGPLDANALRDRIAQGQIVHGTMVWTEGMAGWQPAGEVAALRDLLPQVDPMALMAGRWVAEPWTENAGGVNAQVSSEQNFSPTGQVQGSFIYSFSAPGVPPGSFPYYFNGTYKIAPAGENRYLLTLDVTSIDPTGQQAPQHQVNSSQIQFVDPNTIRTDKGIIFHRQ